jgi:hypothetical protein
MRHDMVSWIALDINTGDGVCVTCDFGDCDLYRVHYDAKFDALNEAFFRADKLSEHHKYISRTAAEAATKQVAVFSCHDGNCVGPFFSYDDDIAVLSYFDLAKEAIEAIQWRHELYLLFEMSRAEHKEKRPLSRREYADMVADMQIAAVFDRANAEKTPHKTDELVVERHELLWIGDE